MIGALEILQLINCVGEIKGRKKLQKMVHILQVCGHEFPHEFGYLHYGPYSSEVASDIDTLKDAKLIHEEPVQEGYDTYVYTPAKAVPKFLEEVGKDEPFPWSELAKELNHKDAQFLEAVSTILYLRKHGHDEVRRREQFTRLKPKLIGRIDQAVEYIGELDKARAM